MNGRALYWKTTEIQEFTQNFKSDQSELYIYSDGAKDKDDFKKVTLVRNYINNIDGFKNIKIT